MKCPKCGGKSEVLETAPQGDRTKRRRRCLTPSCLYRFVSYEHREGDLVTARPQDPDALPEWIDKIRDRPGVDREAIAAAYRVDRRRAQIAREQRERAREERGAEWDEDPPLTREELMKEIRGY